MRIITIVGLMLLATVLYAHAENMFVDGVKYSFDHNTKTFSVTGLSDQTLTDLTIRDYITRTDGDFEVTTIDMNAFKGNETLERINLGNNVSIIKYHAFESCKALKEVVITNVTRIEDAAFRWCAQLESVTGTYNVSTLGNNVFVGCDKLKEVTLSKLTPVASDDNIQSWSPLTNCSGLQRVNLDSPVFWTLHRSYEIRTNNGPVGLNKYPYTFYLNQSSIGSGMIDGCDALEDLNISYDHYYPTGALRDLPSLHSITFGGRGITYLDADAITGCDITTIRCTSPVPPVVIETEEPIEVDKSTCMVKVPAGCAAVYRANRYWGDYANIVEDSEITPAFNVSAVQPQVYINDIGTLGYTIDRENGTACVSGPCFQLIDIEDDGTPMFENTVVNWELTDNYPDSYDEWYDEYGHWTNGPAISKNMSIDLPEGTIKHQGREYEVTKIAPYAGAYNGVKANFGQWCEEIGDYAYYNCPWPEGQKLLLGPSISRIGRKVFANVPTLTCIRVTCGTPAEMDLTAFGDRSLIDLEVPEGKAAVYMAAAGWRDFRSITEYRTAGVSDILTDAAPDGPSEYYTTDGRRVREEQMGRGIYIERRADGTVTKIRR